MWRGINKMKTYSTATNSKQYVGSSCFWKLINLKIDHNLLFPPFLVILLFFFQVQQVWANQPWLTPCLKEDWVECLQLELLPLFLRQWKSSQLVMVWWHALVILRRKIIFVSIIFRLGGAVTSWLVHSTPGRAVQVWTLARDIVLCSWARHFTLTVPLST